MVLVQPEHRARQQEAPHFVAAVVVYIGIPVGMESAAPIGMLEQMGAVEVCETVRVGREVRRHPIKYHADSALVKVIDEKHEVLRRAITCGRCEISGRLIS